MNTTSYSKLNALLFYRWRKSWKVFIPIYVVFTLLSVFFLFRNGSPIGWVRYEVYYEMRPCTMLFLIALAILIGYSLITLIWMQKDVNQIHRYLLLPKARMMIVMSEVMMNMMAIAVLLYLHYLLYYIGYRHYMTLAPFYEIANGLILSIIRSSFVRCLFPLTIPQWCILITSMIMISCIPAYIGLFHHDRIRCIMAAFMSCIVIYVWLFPAGLEMNMMRIVQIGLLIASLIVIVLDTQKAMLKNVAGG